MLKLCNFSNYPIDLEIFREEEISAFLKRHDLDGVEMLLGQDWRADQLPCELIKGVHLPFYPSWLDFWRQDEVALLQSFGSLPEAYDYYGGTHPECLVEKYCCEIEKAIRIGAKYVVFHVSHVRHQEVVSYRFTATDEQVIRASAELLNAVFKRLDTNICLLLENLWWPGLTLCSKENATLLLSTVQHPNKGFMLDTGHLMNTNTELTSQVAGVEYILSTIKNLGTMATYIRGIHLHYSLSGEYVRRAKCSERALELGKVMEHVLKIDQHLPFSHTAVQRILAYVQPDYLVHEFMYRSSKQLSKYITRQNQALGSGEER